MELGGKLFWTGIAGFILFTILIYFLTDGFDDVDLIYDLFYDERIAEIIQKAILISEAISIICAMTGILLKIWL